MGWFALTFPVWVSVFSRSYVAYALCFLFLFFVSGFRFYVGSDYDNYAVLFVSDDSSKYVEYSFSLITSVLKSLGLNYQSMFLFYSFLTFAFFAVGFKRLATTSNDLAAYLLLFYIFYNYPLFSLVRQGLALAIVFFGATFYLKGSKWVFFTSVLVGALFHFSALVGFLLPFLYVLRLGEKALLFVMCSFLFVVAFNLGDFFYFLSKHLILMDYKGHFSKNISETSLFFKVTTAMLIVLALIVWRYRARLLTERIDAFGFSCLLLLLMIRVVSIDVLVLNRFSFMFYVFTFPLLITFFKHVNLRLRFLITVALVVVTLISDFNRVGKDEFYSHLSLNFCVSGEVCPITTWSEGSRFEDFVL